MSEVSLDNLEMHVAHACNLRCNNCSHYSNYALAGYTPVESADQQMGLWSERIKPRLFSLVGGEPTLHVNLSKLVEVAAKRWRDSIIQLVTNGWFLHRHQSLPEVLERHQVRLEISIHHTGSEYQRKVAEIRQLVEDWQSKYSIHVHWRHSYSNWRSVYRGTGPTMQPYSDGDPRASWSCCPCKWCPQILDGRIYKCPPIAYLPMVDAKFNLGPAWRPYLGYQPLEPDCSDEELQEFLARGPESVCGMCPASPRRLRLANPIPHAAP